MCQETLSGLTLAAVGTANRGRKMCRETDQFSVAVLLEGTGTAQTICDRSNIPRTSVPHRPSQTSLVQSSPSAPPFQLHKDVRRLGVARLATKTRRTLVNSPRIFSRGPNDLVPRHNKAILLNAETEIRSTKFQDARPYNGNSRAAFHHISSGSSAEMSVQLPGNSLGDIQRDPSQ